MLARRGDCDIGVRAFMSAHIVGYRPQTRDARVVCEIFVRYGLDHSPGDKSMELLYQCAHGTKSVFVR